MKEIVVATSNPHKVEEIHATFAAEGLKNVRLLSLADVVRAAPGLVLHEPEEIGTTFEANATIKALSYARQTRTWCLADDSGLEVDELQGRPGVISSHYGTDGVETGLTRAQRDAQSNARVMREMDGVPQHKRGARFVCVMVLAGFPQGASEPRVMFITRGRFEGRLGVAGDVPRGEHGFGYDPLFLVAADPHRYSRTSAELSAEEKNRLSHRGMAAREMAARSRAW
jgi:non-canonical purine NTP pyrophosphatase (RdgB/HAM1 family)